MLPLILSQVASLFVGQVVETAEGELVKRLPVLVTPAQPARPAIRSHSVVWAATSPILLVILSALLDYAGTVDWRTMVPGVAGVAIQGVIFIALRLKPPKD